MVTAPDLKFCLVDGADDSFIPVRGTSLSTGYDVRSLTDVTIRPFEKVMISLGLKAFIPDGFWLELRPRSSSFAKKNLHALYGLVDQDYENQIFFCCRYIPEVNFENLSSFSGFLMDYNKKPVENLSIKKGDAIGQLVLVPRYDANISSVSSEEFDRLCKERNGSRGLGGFGSTG